MRLPLSRTISCSTRRRPCTSKGVAATIRIPSHARAQRRVPIVLLLGLLATPLQGIAQEPAAPGPAPNELPRRLLTDARQLATKVPLITIAAGGALALAVHPFDQQVVRSLSGNHSAEEALDGGSTGGNGFVQVGIAAGVYGLGYAVRAPRTVSLGAELVEAQAIAGALTQGLKFAVDRQRPDGGSRSFPSGHASATFATAGVLAENFGWRLAVPAYASAAYVGMSRVADRRHYASDVIFGAALGIASAHAVHRQPGSGRASITLAPLPHGVALSGVVRLGL
jgi:membrane-associated phospholipid phosphatase